MEKTNPNLIGMNNVSGVDTSNANSRVNGSINSDNTAMCCEYEIKIGKSSLDKFDAKAEGLGRKCGSNNANSSQKESKTSDITQVCLAEEAAKTAKQKKSSLMCFGIAGTSIGFTILIVLPLCCLPMTLPLVCAIIITVFIVCLPMLILLLRSINVLLRKNDKIDIVADRKISEKINCAIAKKTIQHIKDKFPRNEIRNLIEFIEKMENFFKKKNYSDDKMLDKNFYNSFFDEENISLRHELITHLRHAFLYIAEKYYIPKPNSSQQSET